MNKSKAVYALLVAASFLVVACGGGGGGNTASSATPVTATNGGNVSTVVKLSGTVTFDFVPNATGALNYAAVTQKPVRGATIEVINSSTSAVLATTQTGPAGDYAFDVPSSTNLKIRVRAELTQAAGTTTWDVKVLDNTAAGAQYALVTPAFDSGTAATLTKTLNAGSGWDGSGYTAGARASAPFAILDTIYQAQQKVLGADPATKFPPLQVFWSPQNVGNSGSIALGQIGTTFFGTQIIGGVTQRAIFVLGMENSDTDENDNSVIAHEWGHYYQSAFSRDDSVGGMHGGADRLDRRVAFSEGWGNGWSGISTGRSNYVDSIGTGQALGFQIDLSRKGANTSSPNGWFRESDVGFVIWDLNRQLGFAPVHAAMTQGLKTTSAVTSIHAFADALRTGSPGSTAVLNGLLAGVSINATSNAFGSQETNDGGLASALPLYRAAATFPGTVSTPATNCVSKTFDPKADINKLGSFTYISFQVATTGNYTIKVDGPTGSDPDFEVYNKGRVFAQNSDQVLTLPGSETGTTTLGVGPHVLVITDYKNSATSTCFTATITKV